MPWHAFLPLCANARVGIDQLKTRDWCALQAQTQIQRLLALGVRSSYPTSVLDSINELSLPELVLDQNGPDRVPVRARLPGCQEWVEVRGYSF